MGLIVIIHQVQSEDTVVYRGNFVSPILDRDKMVQLSAYIIENLVLYRLAKQKDQIMYFQMRKVGR